MGERNASEQRFRLSLLSVGLAFVALLVMTLRFPPNDLGGWLAEALGVPVPIVMLLCAILATSGFVLAQKANSRAAIILNLATGLAALLSTLTSAISLLAG